MRESIQSVNFGVFGEGLFTQKQLKTEHQLYSDNARFFGNRVVCARCGVPASSVRHPQTPYFKHEANNPLSAKCAWFSERLGQSARHEAALLGKAEELLFGKLPGTALPDAESTGNRNWLLTGIEALARAGLERKSNRRKKSTQLGNQLTPQSTEAFTKIVQRSQRQEFAEFLGFRRDRGAAPNTCVHSLGLWKSKADGLQRKRENYLFATLTRLQNQQWVKVFLQLCAEIACARHPARLPSKSSSLRLDHGGEFLHLLAYGKRFGKLEGEADLSSIRAPLWNLHRTNPIAFGELFAPILEVARELIASFPFLHVLRTELAGELGESRAKEATYIYLIENVSKPNAVKVGFSQDPELAAQTIGARTYERDILRVVETSLCYSWIEVEKAVRNELAQALGGTLQVKARGSAEWVWWPTAASRPNLEVLANVFREIAPRVAAEMAVLKLGPIKGAATPHAPTAARGAATPQRPRTSSFANISIKTSRQPREAGGIVNQ